jgi:hypothetical protein
MSLNIEITHISVSARALIETNRVFVRRVTSTMMAVDEKSQSERSGEHCFHRTRVSVNV